ncbi:MAG: DUF3240 family protein [Proteobacteria bacterium]|nr:DUF3240 family protein [Pseudomonadota bacterium]HQR03603.1 DUF3240 family protein [Rhodocyclaceae bacterium]
MTDTVLLTLVAPRSAAPQVEDLLLSCPPPVSGFLGSDAAGHGLDLVFDEPGERVRGRARRIVFQVVAPRPAMDALLALLGERLTNVRLHYWITPVLALGSIG